MGAQPTSRHNLLAVFKLTWAPTSRTFSRYPLNFSAYTAYMAALTGGLMGGLMGGLIGGLMGGLMSGLMGGLMGGRHNLLAGAGAQPTSECRCATY